VSDSSSTDAPGAAETAAELTSGDTEVKVPTDSQPTQTTNTGDNVTPSGCH